MHRLALSLCLFVVPVTCFAEKAATLTPQLLKLGKPAMEDSFDSGQLSKSWIASKGSWTIGDGALVAKELSADKHAAVGTLQHANQDSAVQFSFRLDGTQGFHFSLNHAKGHLFRVTLAGGKVTLRTDVDKKDPSSKSVMLGTATGSFDQGQWYTMLVEMKGDQVVVTTDNGVKIAGQHPSLATAKPNYRWVVQGESVSFDDVKVWDDVR